ncbi:hypothetical protein [Enterobacter hormaechei]|uniref:hypothetical protein n=1 Tax=Enterobacter hormaechei TaxID=158836 RepID=UPI003890D57C
MSIKNLVEMIKHNGLLASMAQLEKLYQVAIENEKKLAELESNLAALAAENANARNAVQTFCDVVGANTDAICEEVGQDGVRAILAAMNATGNMPATDAFLAEVRAAAVDEVCLKISNAIVNCYQDEQVGLDAAATICGDFAAQLRKGVQS